MNCSLRFLALLLLRCQYAVLYSWCDSPESLAPVYTASWYCSVVLLHATAPWYCAMVLLHGIAS
jgi:hypothetical protein